MLLFQGFFPFPGTCHSTSAMAQVAPLERVFQEVLGEGAQAQPDYLCRLCVQLKKLKNHSR